MTKPTIWPIYVIGVVCLAVAATLAVVFAWGDPVGFVTSPAQDAAVALPLLAALAAFRAGRDERRRHRAETAPAAPVRRRRSEPIAPLPRLGDDPFRELPAAPPVVVERPGVVVQAPIVPGDPQDRPKLLT